MKQWKVYILRCRDNSLYTGVTVDISKRLDVHRSGNGSKYVRSRLPVKLVYIQELDSHSSALKEEIRIKKLPKAQKEKLLSWQWHC